MLTVVLCDSVLGGRDCEVPSVGAAFAAAGVNSEIRLFARPLLLLSQQLESLDTVVDAGPDLVIIGHGGSEALTFPRPANAGLVPPPPRGERSTNRLTLWSRANPLAASVRRAARLLFSQRRPTAVQFADFERTYRLFLRELLTRTAASIVLVGAVGADPRYFPHDPQFLADWDVLIGELEAESDRVTAIFPSRLLHRWSDYRFDRTHLTPSGHSVVAKMLAEAIPPTTLHRARG